MRGRNLPRPNGNERLRECQIDRFHAVSMQGDTLKLTGKSGFYRTVNMLFPVQKSASDFLYFVNCSDADSNYYAVVHIGSQLWMRKKPKTTTIPRRLGYTNVPDSATWGNLTTGAWLRLSQPSAEGEYLVISTILRGSRSRNMWTRSDGMYILTVNGTSWRSCLDNTVDTTALGGTGTIIGRYSQGRCNTRWDTWISTYGLNSAGFTALCSNFRNASGAWSWHRVNNHDDSLGLRLPIIPLQQVPPGACAGVTAIFILYFP